jgi:hypothetical protein
MEGIVVRGESVVYGDVVPDRAADGHN